MKKFVLASVATFTCAVAAFATQQTMIGDWMLTVDEDRFSGGKTVIAMTAQTDGLFAVRCIQHILTLALTQPAGDFKAGDDFAIKFRADEFAVVDTVGDAINDRVIEVLLTPEMRNELIRAREYAFRVTTPAGSQFDSVFEVGLGGRAIAEVLKACPAE